MGAPASARPRGLARRRAICSATLAVCLTLVLGGCGDASDVASDTAAEAIQQNLQGSWLREYQDGGIQARRLLVLQADGHFQETARVTDPAGVVVEHRHEGRWFFDGTNLKRRYSRIDGRPPSRLNVPFATFAVRFESRNAFVGVDHIHHHEVRYRRVQPETALW